MDFAVAMTIVGGCILLVILYAMQGSGLFLKGKQANLAEFARVHNTVHGLPVRWELTMVSQGKSNYYKLLSHVVLPSAPEGLVIKNEGIATGFYRIGNQKEQTIDDPDFDAAFWIEAANRPQLEYLTPLRRRTMLCGMTRNPGWTLANRKLINERWFISSLFGRSTYAAIWADLELLVDGLEGTGERVPEKAPDVVASKVRKFVPATMVVLALTLPYSLSMPGLLPAAMRWGALIGLTFSLLALTGGEAGRVLLQGYYAFLSLTALALAGALALGYLGTFKKSDDLVVSVVAMLGFSLCFWAARHYLKSLRR